MNIQHETHARTIHFQLADQLVDGVTPTFLQVIFRFRQNFTPQAYRIPLTTLSKNNNNKKKKK